ASLLRSYSGEKRSRLRTCLVGPAVLTATSMVYTPRRAGGPFGAERRAAHLGAAPPFPAGRRRITVPAVQEPNDPAGTRSPHGSTSQLPRAAHRRAPLPHDRGGAAAHLRAAGRPLRACGER